MTIILVLLWICALVGLVNIFLDRRRIAKEEKLADKKRHTYVPYVPYENTKVCNFEDVFRNCTRLTGTLTIPDSIDTIGSQSFYSPRNIQGPLGLQGTTGATGAVGIQGVQGATGSQGIQGTQGFQGMVGMRGTQIYTDPLESLLLDLDE